VRQTQWYELTETLRWNDVFNNTVYRLKINSRMYTVMHADREYIRISERCNRVFTDSLPSSFGVYDSSLRGRFAGNRKLFRWQDDSLTRWRFRNSVDKSIQLARCQRNVMSVKHLNSETTCQRNARLPANWFVNETSSYYLLKQLNTDTVGNQLLITTYCLPCLLYAMWRVHPATLKKNPWQFNNVAGIQR